MSSQHAGSMHPGMAAHGAADQQGYQWAYSIMDSSRVSTFFISILLIVYGSFRSLALEEDHKDGKSQKTRNNTYLFVK